MPRILPNLCAFESSGASGACVVQHLPPSIKRQKSEKKVVDKCSGPLEQSGFSRVTCYHTGRNGSEAHATGQYDGQSVFMKFVRTDSPSHTNECQFAPMLEGHVAVVRITETMTVVASKFLQCVTIVTDIQEIYKAVVSFHQAHGVVQPDILNGNVVDSQGKHYVIDAGA